MTRYALVIGIQKYGESGFGNLTKPVEDAEAIAKILETYGDFHRPVKRLPCSWNEEDKRLELDADKPLTGEDLGTEISKFFEQVGSDEALIYFSGHGHEVIDSLGNRSGYLVTSDCSTETVSSKGVSLEGLNKKILKANCSSLTVLLDCCHSGSLLEDSQFEAALTAILKSDRNRYLAGACRSYEKAYEDEDYSLFTAAVIKVLKFPGVVKTGDLYGPVAKELSGSGQEPFFWGSNKITLTYPSEEKVIAKKLQTTLENLRQDYEILDAPFFEAVANKVKNNQVRARILNLRAANWSMLFQKNYVERDQQGETLEQALQLSQANGISLMLIRGEPGAGKTALLRWLAYELFCKGKRVFHKKTQNQFDWLEQLREFSDESGGTHFYVIADDLFRDEFILETLQQNEFLFPLTLIGTTRKNEDRHDDLQGLGYETVCLDLAKPSQLEKERILALPEIQTHLEEKSAAERQLLMDSPIMLVLMLQLSEGKPFDVLLQDIVKKLPDVDRNPLYQAFGVLCSFFQYGITVPYEILQICLPPSGRSERLIISGLEGLIDTATYGGYEGLTPVHELIAKTVMQLDYRSDAQDNRPYSWIDSPPLLERHLRKIVPSIDGTKESQKRWGYHSLRLLADNGEVELVRRMLQEYSSEVEALQQQNSISAWSHWAKIYAVLGWSNKHDDCIRSIVLSKPKSLWEWVYWLSLVEQRGSREQQKEAIAQTQSWLVEHPDNGDVRVKYLSLVEQRGTSEQQQDAIAQTQSWLVEPKHLDDWYVRCQYLKLVEQRGTLEQQQDAIAQTQSWLVEHPDNGEVRTKYIALVGKICQDKNVIELVIQQQWKWIREKNKVDQGLWQAFLPFLFHHGSPDLYQSVTQLALKQYPDNKSISLQIFGYFRDHLDYTTCNDLAIRISQFQLPFIKWQNFIHAANFFRDCGQLKTAEDIYYGIIGKAHKKVRHNPDLQDLIDFANLNYAQLLLQTNPSQPNKALQKLDPILTKFPKHSYAHLLKAQACQAKGEHFYKDAIHHFKKAIQFDLKEHGFLYHQLGCFYRHVMHKIPDASHCFEQSRNQKLNLPACLELAELEFSNGSLIKAKTLLQEGLSINPITRPEKEEREKLNDRIEQYSGQF
jgi:tetratricopeptide (TPR) repeat protein